MGFFDDFGKKMSQVGQNAAQQTKIIAETAKLNSRISDEEKQINNLYIQIGKNYFEANKDNDSAEYKELMVGITDAQARIAQYQEQIRVVKGIRNCPNCGAEVPNNSAFCNSCGAKMPAQETAPVAAAPASVKCPQCGTDVAAGSKFCDGCGCDLSNAVAAVQNTEIPAPVNSTIPTASNIPVQSNTDTQD